MGCDHTGGTAVIGKWRLKHAAEPDRHEVWRPIDVSARRVSTGCGRCSHLLHMPCCVRGVLVAQGFAYHTARSSDKAIRGALS